MSSIREGHYVVFNDIPAVIKQISFGQVFTTLHSGHDYIPSVAELKVMQQIDKATFDELSVAAKLTDIEPDYDNYETTWVPNTAANRKVNEN